MGDHEWMYNGWAPNGCLTQEWIDDTQDFMMKHLERLKGLKTVKQYGVPAASAETRAKGQSMS
jgi:hypothetical protein